MRVSSVCRFHVGLVVTTLCRNVRMASSATSSAEGTKESSMLGAYFGALVADALCLGSHYEYDAVKIKTAYGGKTISKYMAPGEQMGGETHGIGWGARNYHPGTIAGDQTDYGEYNVLILEYLAHLSSSSNGNNDNNNSDSNKEPFSVEGLIPHWQKRLQSWSQWICTQTKQTYQQVQAGTPVDKLGGNSNAMALRYAALFSFYDSEELVVDAAHKTMFTHKEQTAHLGNEFFAKVTYRIIHNPGLTPRQAMEQVVAQEKENSWIQQKFHQAVSKVEEATNPNKPLSKEEYVDDLALTSMARLWDIGKSEPIKVGKASPTEGTMPGSIYFILKYEDDFVSAVKANAMVGGDNASRSIAVGMVLGAYHGTEAIPNELKNSLNHWEKSEKLIKSLPLFTGDDSNVERTKEEL